MAALTGNSIASTYTGLLKTSDSGARGAEGSADQCSDGAGNTIPLFVSATEVYAVGSGTGTSHTAFGKDCGVGLAAGTGNSLFGEGAGADLSTGEHNVALGYHALYQGTTETDDNVAIGYNAMSGAWTTAAVNDCVVIGSGAGAGALVATASGAVAIGNTALNGLTSGANNLAIGYNAAKTTTTGAQNLAIGPQALENHLTGQSNMAIGYLAMCNTNNGGSQNNSNDSDHNVFIGLLSGGGTWADAKSENNVAVGNYTMDAVMNAADGNTSVGYNTLTELTEGNGNSAIGLRSMDSVTTGNYNTAIGQDSLAGCQGGATNVAIGTTALYDVTSGDNNIGIGLDAGRTGSPGGIQTTGDNKIFFGDENITESNIQVDWTVASDKRDKTDVNDLDLGLEFLNKLNPITYKWDKRAKYIDKNKESADLDNVTPDGTHKEDWLDIGFLAQDVEAIEVEYGHKIADKTNLTTSCTDDGKQYGIQYSKFVPVLVKAIQELSAKVAALENA